MALDEADLTRGRRGSTCLRGAVWRRDGADYTVYLEWQDEGGVHERDHDDHIPPLCESAVRSDGPPLEVLDPAQRAARLGGAGGPQ